MTKKLEKNVIKQVKEFETAEDTLSKTALNLINRLYAMSCDSEFLTPDSINTMAQAMEKLKKSTSRAMLRQAEKEMVEIEVLRKNAKDDSKQDNMIEIKIDDKVKELLE